MHVLNYLGDRFLSDSSEQRFNIVVNLHRFQQGKCFFSKLLIIHLLFRSDCRSGLGSYDGCYVHSPARIQEVLQNSSTT